MRPTLPLRLLIAAGLLVAGALLLVLMLVAADTALSLLDRLRRAPRWLWLAYGCVFAGVLAVVAWAAWRVLRPSRRAQSANQAEPLDPESLRERQRTAAEAGVDIAASRAELEEGERRRAGGRLYVSMFGAVSSGKSSLVRALLPAADIETGPEAGTTAAVSHHRWRAPGGDEIVIADVPGTAAPGGELDAAARREALRAHLVVYVTESDLTRSAWHELETLDAYGKPMLVALNKADRFEGDELEALRTSIRERAPRLDRSDIVCVSAGGSEEVARRGPDGVERIETRQRPPRVAPLVSALQHKLESQRELLDDLHDQAVLLLAAGELEAAESEHRCEQSRQIIRKYSRRAMVGAMAAVAPGSDLVIQGTLAGALIRELSKLHEVPVRQIDIDDFLELAGGRVRTNTSIVLAVAGNACKAFPGLGTLSGGLLHVVAYGMIFESLGRAIATTMANTGRLRPVQAARALEDELRGNLRSHAQRVARQALEEKLVAGSERAGDGER